MGTASSSLMRKLRLGKLEVGEAVQFERAGAETWRWVLLFSVSSLFPLSPWLLTEDMGLARTWGGQALGSHHYAAIQPVYTAAAQ